MFPSPQSVCLLYQCCSVSACLNLNKEILDLNNFSNINLKAIYLCKDLGHSMFGFGTWAIRW